MRAALPSPWRARAVAAVALALMTSPAAGAPAGDEHEVFVSSLGRFADFTWEDLRALWGLEARPEARALSFDPATASYHDEVAEALDLDEEALATLRREGLVVMSPRFPHTMAGILRRIFERDLPLIVTTDAILDAVHRSYTDILEEIEFVLLRPTLAASLEAALGALDDLAAGHPGLEEAAADAELYLAVAHELITAEVRSTTAAAREGAKTPAPRPLRRAPRWADAAEVQALVTRAERAAGPAEITLYGAKRRVDWTQLQPRGHYAEVAVLQPYFRTIQWLGRQDLAFTLDGPRQLRAALAVARAVEAGGAAEGLAGARAVIDLFVGGAGDLDVGDLLSYLRAHDLGELEQLTDPHLADRALDALDAAGIGRPRVRSSLVESDLDDAPHTMPPASVRLFGQRFAIDSFALSHVVYDDIVFRGQKQLRRLPSGLDVFAVLGSDTAARLLRPEIERWNYGANLAALRAMVDARPQAAWETSLYDRWLAGLRTLSTPPASGRVPEVMRRATWQRKMLQTQLASWSQLRRNTLAYVEQSFSAAGGCLYPMALVEPYPAFYAAFRDFGRAAAEGLAQLPVTDAEASEHLERYVGYYERFAQVMGTLEGLARKQLTGQPFTDEERLFLRHTVERHDSREAGYAPEPTWSGWYLDLVYRRGANDTRALDFEPTVADVHTDGHTLTALTVGTGGAELLVVAIDNGPDRAIYVGPVSTYYEFAQPIGDRLTDAAWKERLRGEAGPARPDWLDLPRRSVRELIRPPRRR